MAQALIVEDEDDFLPAIEEALAERGDTFKLARSLEEAHAMFLADDYAYVLLDLRIPERTGGAFPDKEYGIAVLRKIRATIGKERTPVIAMTSYHSDGFGIAPELHALGVNDCVSKPFDEKRPLAKIVEDVLARATASDLQRHSSRDSSSPQDAKTADKPPGDFDWASQAQLVNATNQVLGPDTPFHKGTLSKVVKAGKIKFNGRSGRACRVHVDSFLVWVEKQGHLQNDEVIQIRNAIIGEIREKTKMRK
jgi:CheY-like chemotaxis protein